jgi:hypothetical protein
LNNSGARVLRSDPDTGLRLLGVPRRDPGGGTVTIYRLDGAALPEHVGSFVQGDGASAAKAFEAAVEWLKARR